MNTQLSNHLIATFFANIFLIDIVPKKFILTEYRDNISNYSNSTTAFLNQINPAYNIVQEKLLQYIKQNTGCGDFSNFTCTELCSKFYLEKCARLIKVLFLENF